MKEKEEKTGPSCTKGRAHRPGKTTRKGKGDIAGESEKARAKGREKQDKRDQKHTPSQEMASKITGERNS